jgi:hypothetical protein
LVYYICNVLRFASIVLLFAMLQAVAGKTFVFAWFKANQAYVAQTLCENKAKPTSNCKGKCYLAKQLKKADGESQTQKTPALPQGLKEIKEAETESLLNISFAAMVNTTTSIPTFQYQQAISANYSTVLLRPPIV